MGYTIILSINYYNIMEVLKSKFSGSKYAEPLEFDYENDSMEDIIEKIEYAIEQHPSFLKVLTPEEIEEQELLNKQREW